jgi:hypothetical protein
MFWSLSVRESARWSLLRSHTCYGLRAWSSGGILEGITIADQSSTAVQAQVRAQFDRQVAHYGQDSTMADQGLLELIVRMAGPMAGRRV